MLNAGSGPFAPGPLQCDGRKVAVVAADGNARFYLKLFDRLGVDAPQAPVQCPVERLSAACQQLGSPDGTTELETFCKTEIYLQ